MKLLSAVLSFTAAAACLALAAAQHEHHGMMMMHQAANVRLDVHDDASAHALTIRLGPLDLPAHTSHHRAAQAPNQTFTIPFDGWIVAYHPRLTDDAGRALPGHLLHHVAVYNLNRSDFLCPSKPEHIFGAGGEMTDWPAQPGFGYRVHPGDRILVSTMVHNPTDKDYPKTYLEVRMDYLPLGAPGTPLQSVYPAWFDVKACGESAYDLTPGRNVTSGELKLAYDGVLIGVGGHLHDYGQELELENLTRHETVATLHARLDTEGHLLSIPIVTFQDRGGYPLKRGEVLKTTATYDNRTGKPIPEGAMGIVVGYFLPARPDLMAGLARHMP